MQQGRSHEQPLKVKSSSQLRILWPWSTPCPGHSTGSHPPKPRAEGQQHLEVLSTSKPVPWLLLSSSLKRASRAQGHYSHAGGLSQEREGRRCVLGDAPLKSLSFPVSNLQSGRKCSWGSILTWCCLRGPEAEAHSGAGPGSRTGSQHCWCLWAHCSIPVLAWKVSPSPRVACLLISLCLSLLTISSSTSPSPLISLVLPVSGSTTLLMTLCLASHSSFVIGFIAWIRDFCSSVKTGPASTRDSFCHCSSEGPGTTSPLPFSSFAFSFDFFFDFFFILFFFFLLLSLSFARFFLLCRLFFVLESLSLEPPEEELEEEEDEEELVDEDAGSEEEVLAFLFFLSFPSFFFSSLAAAELDLCL